MCVCGWQRQRTLLLAQEGAVLLGAAGPGLEEPLHLAAAAHGRAARGCGAGTSVGAAEARGEGDVGNTASTSSTSGGGGCGAAHGAGQGPLWDACALDAALEQVASQAPLLARHAPAAAQVLAALCSLMLHLPHAWGGGGAAAQSWEQLQRAASNEPAGAAPLLGEAQASRLARLLAQLVACAPDGVPRMWALRALRTALAGRLVAGPQLRQACVLQELCEALCATARHSASAAVRACACEAAAATAAEVAGGAEARGEGSGADTCASSGGSEGVQEPCSEGAALAAVEHVSRGLLGAAEDSRPEVQVAALRAVLVVLQALRQMGVRARAAGAPGAAAQQQAQQRVAAGILAHVVQLQGREDVPGEALAEVVAWGRRAWPEALPAAGAE